jgi:hypothetical protein
MERTQRSMRLTGTAVAMAAGIAVLAGCGSDDSADYANEARPPTPIVVSASIGSDRVSVSPRRFGAGPVTLIVTNQTGQSREITLETDEIGGSAPGIEQNSGPINPGDTASLKADLTRGTYRVAVDDRGIDAARLNVGKQRASAQNELLQP